MVGVATNHGGKAAPAPVTAVAEAPPPPLAAVSSEAPEGPDPMRTGERIELPMTGPSRRTLVTMFLGVGLGCAALGGLVAVRTFRAPAAVTEPVTTVGLIGEPSAVDPVDAGASSDPPSMPPRGAVVPTSGRTPSTASRGASTGRPAPATPGAPPGPTRPDPAAPAAPSGPVAARPDPASPTPASPTAPTAPGTAAAAPDPAAPTPAPTPGTAAAGPDGLVERGPRTSQGGYTQGEETDATGRMDPTAFTYVYRHYSPQISACYSSASRNRVVNGVVVMRVRIAENGSVRRTRVVSDTVRVPELVECLQNSVRTWRYPQPEGGEVEVDYPMRFGSAR